MLNIVAVDNNKPLLRAVGFSLHKKANEEEIQPVHQILNQVSSNALLLQHEGECEFPGDPVKMQVPMPGSGWGLRLCIPSKPPGDVDPGLHCCNLGAGVQLLAR